MTSSPSKRAVVLGLGKSGRSACELLRARGFAVTALDEKAGDEALVAKGVTVKVGPWPLRFWEGAELVVLSPGIPRSKPEVQSALSEGAKVIGEIELAWRLLPEGAGPVLGITGTNGKSTTTALLGELMKRGGGDVFVGGNLGLPFSEAGHARHDWHVVELSSFQLESLEQTTFRGGAYLNLTPDHIDRYPSHEAYGAAKAKLFERLDPKGYAVVNADDDFAVRAAARCKAKVYAFSTDPSRTNAGFAGTAYGEGRAFRLMFGGKPTFELRSTALRGKHNLQNAMAATLLAHLSGVGDAAIQKGLDAFAGLPHRLESVATVKGVEWVNDSKATNVDSTLVALAAFDGGLWLVLGGKGKGAPYAPLVQAAKGKVKGVLTIGQDAPTIEKAFEGSGIAVHGCETLEAAVQQARRLAKSGDVVLLSPACASYDQFQHFEHRGDTFKNLVRALS